MSSNLHNIFIGTPCTDKEDIQTIVDENMAFDFSGKKVLVTGAGQGVGRGIAVALAKAGCKVYALDIVKENLDNLATEYPNIVIILQDLKNWETTRTKLEVLDAMDGLVNCAAIVDDAGPALETPKEEIDKILSVNLFAYINCIQVIGKKMVATEKIGSIVNVSSIAAMLAIPHYLGYRVSKAGVDMVTKQFALELGPYKIRVNSVNPSMVNTGIIPAELRDSTRIRATERMPIARPAEVDEIVGPVLYLLSDLSSMVTGTSHLVDGGLTCNITTKS